MDNGFIVMIVCATIFMLCLAGFELYSVENIRTCKMEAAAKGYNVKEICE